MQVRPFLTEIRNIIFFDFFDFWQKPFALLNIGRAQMGEPAWYAHEMWLPESHFGSIIRVELRLQIDLPIFKHVLAPSARQLPKAIVIKVRSNRLPIRGKFTIQLLRYRVAQRGGWRQIFSLEDSTIKVFALFILLLFHYRFVWVLICVVSHKLYCYLELPHQLLRLGVCRKGSRGIICTSRPWYLDFGGMSFAP